MKKARKKLLAVLVILAAILIVSPTVYCGDLEPPGPPTTGTMKTLDEVEPRIPIRQNDMPLTISQSGSYYLTENIQTSGTAITIEANDVTIDLMGYSLTGPGSGNNYGIYMNGRSNIEIRNGTVRGFGVPGEMILPGYPAIFEGSVNDGKGHRLIDVRVVSNGGSGIYLSGSGHTVADCTATGNGQYGIYAGYGSEVTGNAAYKNAASGICAEAGSTVADNSSYRNQGLGISVGSCSTVARNTSFDNNAQGIYAYYGSTLTGNTAADNNDHGIYANEGCTLVGNTTYANWKCGIYLANDCLLDQNTAYSNNRSGGGYANISACATCVFGVNKQ